MRPAEHHDISACARCEHGNVGPISGISYCTAKEPRDFAHAMRQPAAPCGPGAFLFVPRQP